jgi:hypothetical protein
MAIILFSVFFYSIIFRCIPSQKLEENGKNRLAHGKPIRLEKIYLSGIAKNLGVRVFSRKKLANLV